MNMTINTQIALATPKRRKDEHHDHLLTMKRTINTHFALATPREELSRNMTKA